MHEIKKNEEGDGKKKRRERNSNFKKIYVKAHYYCKEEKSDIVNSLQDHSINFALFELNDWNLSHFLH